MISLGNDSQFEWQNIDFKNFDSKNTFEPRADPGYIQKKDSSLLLHIPKSQKYFTQQKLIKLLSNDIVCYYDDGIQHIMGLYPSLKHACNQLKLDLNRQVCTINNMNVQSYNQLLDYIDYNIKNCYDKKLIISSCTQAIMSIPLITINNMFDMESYVLGETSDSYDKTMYIDLEIEGNDWNIHIQKPLRIFDTYDTLYCILVDLEIDKEGLVLSIRPFL